MALINFVKWMILDPMDKVQALAKLKTKEELKEVSNWTSSVANQGVRWSDGMKNEWVGAMQNCNDDHVKKCGCVVWWSGAYSRGLR